MAQHYIGYTKDTERRFNEHFNLRQNGNALVKAVIQAGIKVLFHVWDKEGREFEQKIKRSKNAKRFCPICNANKFRISDAL